MNSVIFYTRNIFILLSLTILMTACNLDVVFSDSKEVNVDRWHIDSVVAIDADLSRGNFGDDSYRIDLFVRNSGDYQNQNLWLFVDYVTPDSVSYRDTLNIFLADEMGRWVGSGMGSFYTVTVPLVDSLTLESGVYSFRIQQGMRYDMLKGIGAVGIAIEKIE